MLTSTSTYPDNVLYQLAQTMTSGGRHLAAVALRQEQVDFDLGFVVHRLPALIRAPRGPGQAGIDR